MFSASAAAARLRAEDPLFDHLSDGEKREAAQELIAEMGGDPDDILTVAMIIAAPEARRVASEVLAIETLKQSTPKQLSLVARFMLATRLTDGQTAAILRMSRPTINLWKNGHAPERLTPTQREELRKTAEEQIIAIQALLDELVDNRQAVA
jgi:hypothetical protein